MKQVHSSVFRMALFVIMAAFSAGGCDQPITPTTVPQETTQTPPPPVPPPAPPPANVVVSGVVHEAVPTSQRVIVGATVAVNAGDRTETAVTDPNGNFSVTVPAGEIRVTVSAARHETVTSTVTASAATHLDLAVPYTFRMIGETFEGQGRAPRLTFQLPVHHDGIISFRGYACVPGCSASEFEGQCADLRDETGAVIAHAQGGYDNGPRNDGVAVRGGHVYELILSQCAGPRQGFPLDFYHVEVHRPI